MSDWQLRKNPSPQNIPGPVVVCVMDGVGLGIEDDSNAVWLARTPNLDWLRSHVPTTELAAHGVAVGMPSDADMGNSEVGHNALGAGRVFDQGAKLVQQAVESGELFESESWTLLTQRVRQNSQATLHFIGLLSDGNVHSHINHLKAMLKRAHAESVKRVRIHILLDGRDVHETSAFTYVDDLEVLLLELNASGTDYRIASGGGRMKITMDRYGAEWGMVERGWRTHVLGEGRGFPSARTAIQTFRDETPKLDDQNLPPFVITENGAPIGRVLDGDAVIFFNFRGDRAIEITQAFEQATFDEFDRVRRPDVLYAGMTQYDGDLKLPRHFLVYPPKIDLTLGEYLARNGVTQLAISETQKFGHVTYFWNGNRSGKFDDNTETYIEIPSDTLPFEERPWMKASEITDRLLAELATGKFRHARLNYANGDMVGHTGFRDAAVVAVEAVDLQLGRLMRFIERAKGALIVTADHGNADEMFEHDKKTNKIACDASGAYKLKTSHTLNPVPFHLYAPSAPSIQIDASVAAPGLANMAATTLALLGFQAPEAFRPSVLKA